MDMDKPILQLQGLRTEFKTGSGWVTAVDDLSYSVNAGETLGIVGESGCGKSVSSLCVLRLLPEPPGRISGGEIWYGGEDLTKVAETRIRDIRGNEIAMVFQEPMTTLNPLMTIGTQLCEPIMKHQGLSRKDAMQRAHELLQLVRIPDARHWLKGYPHEMSGGMRQRVVIAMALACSPKVLIADEPTTALDVTIQAQILALLKELQDRLGMAVIMVTHDLGVIAEIADRVVVMYAGSKVEEATVEDLFARPRHPYTHGLFRAIPDIDSITSSEGAPTRLEEIPGMVPALDAMPSGCPFSTRCPFVIERCLAERPILEEKAPGHFAACFRELS